MPVTLPVDARSVFDAPAIRSALEALAKAIAAKHEGREFYLVGLERRGVHMAKRLAALIGQWSSCPPEVGTLDISLYRDDLDLTTNLPKLRDSVITFDLEGARVVLVDDVLFTGRTIRAALEAMMDYGRPSLIELAVLLDRGHRELPIHADYVGLTLETALSDYVRVQMEEIDQRDAVVIGSRPARS